MTRKMRWYAGNGHSISHYKGHYATQLEDGTEIEVHPEVYHQRFREHLGRIGVKETTYAEIMEKAEQEWSAFYAVKDAFAEDVEQWREEGQTRGVVLRPPCQQETSNERGKTMSDFEQVAKTTYETWYARCLKVLADDERHCYAHPSDEIRWS